MPGPRRVLLRHQRPGPWQCPGLLLPRGRRACARTAGSVASIGCRGARVRAARVRHGGRDAGQLAADRRVPPRGQRVPVDCARVLALAGQQRGFFAMYSSSREFGARPFRRCHVLREFAFLLVHPHGPRGVRVHLRLRDAADLVAAPVRARHPRHAELGRQLTLHRRRRDRLQRAEDRAQARGVMRPPLPIAERSG